MGAVVTQYPLSCSSWPPAVWRSWLCGAVRGTSHLSLAIESKQRCTQILVTGT